MSTGPLLRQLAKFQEIETAAYKVVEHPPSWAKAFIYVVNTQMQWQKIGCSIKPSRRAVEITKLPFNAWMEHIFPVGHRAIEHKVHGCLWERRLRSEWFELCDDGMDAIKSVCGIRCEADMPEALLSLKKSSRMDRKRQPLVTLDTEDPDYGCQAKRLTLLRARKGVTHTVAAKLIGLHTYLVLEMERIGLAKLSLHSIRNVAKYYNVKVDDLLAPPGNSPIDNLYLASAEAM